MPQAPGTMHAAIAIGAQRLALVEVHDRRVGARAAQSDAAERELALLRLPVRHQRPGLARHLDVGTAARACSTRAAIHGPGATTTVSHSNRPALVAIASTPLSPSSKPTTSTPSRISAPAPRAWSARWRTVCIASAQPPRRSCRIASTGASQSGPRPGQVLATALRADHELGRVSHPLVLLADRHQVVDLAAPAPPPGSRPAASRRPRASDSKISTDIADQLGDRLGAVVVAHDPARAAGRSAADAPLVEHDHVGAALGQAPGDRQPVDSGADDDVRGHQLQGYGLFETGCRSPVAKRS